MMARRRGCWSAMDATPLKRCSSTSRVAVPTYGKPRSEQASHEAPYRIRSLTLYDFLAPDRRNDRTLLVSLAFIMAATPRARVLARGTDADVGLPAALYRSECRIFRPGRRHLYRRGAAVGHSVPRPAGLFADVPG